MFWVPAKDGNPEGEGSWMSQDKPPPERRVIVLTAIGVEREQSLAADQRR